MRFPPQVSGAGRFGRGRAVLAALLGVLAVPACGPGHGTDCLKSTGSIITERRAVAAGLQTVNLLDNVDLNLVQDTETYAEVQAGEHLIDDIDFDRQGSALTIGNTSKCNWVRSYNTPRVVTLHLPRLTNIVLRGSGNLHTVGEWKQDTIFVHVNGTGDADLQLACRQVYADLYLLSDLTLRGTTEELNFTLGSGGSLFATGLNTQRCYLVTTRDSQGNAHVRSTQFVAGTVAGHGTVFYAGPPATTAFDIKAPGQVRAE